MRETRNAQLRIFDSYANHELGKQLEALSAILDEHPAILSLVGHDLGVGKGVAHGACGLSVESVFRCLFLNQIVGVSYERLAFHLRDSNTYRSFARLHCGQAPSRSGLQSTVRQISPSTLEQINRLLMGHWVESSVLKLDAIRIDSTVVESNILCPYDSQLLDDGVRVLSRMLFQCKRHLGVKLRFTDQRKRSKSLAFRIFHAKLTEKQVLYPKLLSCVGIVLTQVSRAIDTVRLMAPDALNTRQWIEKLEHYRDLLLRVVDQTQRRVYDGETVPASEKIVSLFEEHTDIIVKGKRDVQYGHKVNLATQADGFIAHLSCEKGNPADSTLYLPVLTACQSDYAITPQTIVADGCYISHDNIEAAKTQGVKRTVFNKPAGLSYADMGVKKKTFLRWRNFRAGVEGNISELKRAFGASRAMWKREDGFHAFVWSSVLSYNLVRMARFSSA